MSEKGPKSLPYKDERKYHSLRMSNRVSYYCLKGNPLSKGDFNMFLAKTSTKHSCDEFMKRAAGLSWLEK